MESKKIEVTNIRLPRWNELPNINLYMDQVLTYIETNLYNYIKLDVEEKLITKTMINNYVKQEVIHAPINKKYNKLHLAELFVICILKEVYSISDIKTLITLALQVSPADVSYNNFCNVFEESIQSTFNGTEYSSKSVLSEEEYILKNVIQSCVNKFYVQITYLKKYEL